MTPPPGGQGRGAAPRLRAVPRVEPADPAAEPADRGPAEPARPDDPSRAGAAAAAPARRAGPGRPAGAAPLRGGPGRPAADARRGGPPQAAPIPPRARPKARHWGCSPASRCWCSLPFAASVWYLYARAADQYHSEVAFSIRSEEGTSAAAAGSSGR